MAISCFFSGGGRLAWKGVRERGRKGGREMYQGVISFVVIVPSP